MCRDFIVENKDHIDMSNILTSDSWHSIFEKIHLKTALYFIGSPHPCELEYIKNQLLVTTVTYEFKKSICEYLSTGTLTNLKVLDYEQYAPFVNELKLMKNIYFTKESKSLFKLLIWTYFLCHYKIECHILGDDETFKPLIQLVSEKWKHIIHLKYDPTKRSLCRLSLNR